MRSSARGEGHEGGSDAANRVALAERLVAAPQGADRPGAPQRAGQGSDQGQPRRDRQPGVDHHLGRQEDRQGADPLAGAAALPLRSRPEEPRRPGPGRARRSATCSARSRAASRARGRARASRPATCPGIDYYEAEITVDELAALVFEDLGPAVPEAEGPRDRRVRGRPLRRDPQDRPDDQPGQAPHDPREPACATPGPAAPASAASRTTTCASRPGSAHIREESNAVVIAMRDVSGSMGEFEKYITRSFYFWMVRFLRTRYTQVQIVFITHHTEAQGGRRRDVLQPRRERRHQGVVGLPACAGHRQRAVPGLRVEHLPVPLLGRRQLGRGRQPALPGPGEGAARALQRVRLRRDPGGRPALAVAR